VSRRSQQASGRENALASVEEHLVAALRGHGRIVGVTGDPGTGRSELTLAFLRSCRERGLAISGVECLAHGHPAAFVSGRELLRAVLDVSERDAPDLAQARIESGLLPLDPGIGSELPLLFRFLGLEDPEEPVAEPGVEREALLAIVARIVRATSGGVAQVLLVDDVDHIDPASSDLISAIAEAADGSRTLLVTTAAPGHQAPWMDKPCFHGLELTQDAPAPAATPLVGALADDERHVLGIGAAIGMHFSVPMMRRCCDLAAERIAAALYALQRSGLIRSRSRTPDPSFAIIGLRIRDAALDALSDGECAAAHRRIALAMEELDFERLDERAALIAHHWERAGEPAAASRWHRHAARCVAHWAPDVARSHSAKAEPRG
jgi:predicted ATPase